MGLPLSLASPEMAVRFRWRVRSSREPFRESGDFISFGERLKKARNMAGRNGPLRLFQLGDLYYHLPKCDA